MSGEPRPDDEWTFVKAGELDWGVAGQHDRAGGGCALIGLLLIPVALTVWLAIEAVWWLVS